METTIWVLISFFTGASLLLWSTRDYYKNQAKHEEYTSDELKHLFLLKLKEFDEEEDRDDVYTNNHIQFDDNVSLFLDWLKEIETSGEVENILKNIPQS